MSKLAEQIHYAITNKRAVDNTYDFIYAIEPANINNNYLCQVSFDAYFGCRYYIDQALTHKNSEVLAHTLKQVKLSIIEEVFGEFRKPIMEIRHHLYNRDTNLALETLTNLEKRMFNV